MYSQPGNGKLFSNFELGYIPDFDYRDPSRLEYPDESDKKGKLFIVLLIENQMLNKSTDFSSAYFLPS